MELFLVNSGMVVQRSGINSKGFSKKRSSVSMLGIMTQQFRNFGALHTSLERVKRNLHDCVSRDSCLPYHQTLRWSYSLKSGRNGRVQSKRLVNQSIQMRKFRQRVGVNLVSLAKILINLKLESTDLRFMRRQLEEEVC